MPQYSYKTAPLLFFAGILLTISLIAGAFVVYDPMQLFHPAWGRTKTYHANMRQQAAGIIRNVPFDSIILGTSMMENTSAADAEMLLGGDFVNISISGSFHAERAPVLSFALQQKKLRTVIYTIDSMEPFDENPQISLSSFDYLYDENRINDLLAYANDLFLGCLVRWSAKPHCVGAHSSLDRPNAWFEIAEHSSRFGGLSNWFSTENNSQIQDAIRLIVKSVNETGKASPPGISTLREAREKLLSYLDRHTLANARRHPEVSFHFVFPPYSRAKFAIWRQSEPLEAELHRHTLRFFAEAASRLPNVTVYAYEDEKFLNDIANYKDLNHYSPAIDSLILHSIGNKTNRIDASNVEAYLKVADEQALAYDLASFGESLEAYLSRQRPSTAPNNRINQ